jgi:hypothetical protein
MCSARLVCASLIPVWRNGAPLDALASQNLDRITGVSINATTQQVVVVVEADVELGVAVGDP